MRRSLHFGVLLPNYGNGLSVEALVDAARAAEESGFDSVWTTDHVMVPVVHAPVYGNITEAMVTLGYVAARTERVTLGVSALVVPLRNPFVALKQLTSLDYLSGGRIVTSVAAGWMQGEFATLGADFERRGRMLDEWLDMAADVFGQMPGEVRHEKRLRIDDAWMEPALVRPGGPGLWVAGVSEATLRRAAKTGVWHPTGLTPKQLRPMADGFRARRPDGKIVNRIAVRLTGEDAGRATDARGRPSIVGSPDFVRRTLDDHVEAGCDGFLINFDRDEPGIAGRIGRFGDALIGGSSP